MTAFEHSNDSEMESFFDVEMQNQLSSILVEHEHSIVIERLWAAIESLDMDLAVGRDETTHTQDFAALEESVGDIIDSMPPQPDPDYSRKELVYAMASDIWDEETAMIEQISLALDMQLHGSIPDPDKAMIKKWLMARLMTEEGDHTRWIQLTDTALVGDPLDLTDPDDFTILTDALEKKANLESTPEAQFHNSILTLLGVPVTIDEITDDFDFDQIEHLSYAARDLTEVVISNPKQSQQPERHSSIHEVLQTYCLTDEVDIATVLKLSDTYVESKLVQ